MKQITIYPYNHDAEILLKYKELLVDYNIIGISSFKEDSVRIKQLQKKYNILETENLEEASKDTDSILLCEPVINLNNYISPKYIEFINEIQDETSYKKPKEILVSKELYKRLEKVIEFKNYRFVNNEYKMKNLYKTDQLLAIPAPVIAIVGLGENCSKFEVQLLVKKVVSDMGYQSTVLCTNAMGSLFGMSILPEFLFKNELSYQDKIIHFNHYVYDICKTQNPDVLIIGLPSGIMPLGEDVFNYFAEIPSIISSALNIDMGILNIYFEQYIGEDYLESLESYCLQKFGFKIESFCISRQRVEYSLADKKFEIYYFEEEFIQKILHDMDWNNYPVINLADEKGAEDRIKSLIHLLEENLSIV